MIETGIITERILLACFNYNQQAITIINRLENALDKYVSKRFTYFFFFLSKPAPANPKPNNKIEAGAGTGTGG